MPLRKRSNKGDYNKSLIETEDIASAMMFMTSDQASYSTGEILTIDAGYSQTDCLYKEFEQEFENGKFPV